MENSLNDLIVDQLQGLSLNQQARVLEFVHALKSKGTKGTPGRKLLRFVGTISKEDLDAMQAAIEEGCEQIDYDGW